MAPTLPPAQPAPVLPGPVVGPSASFQGGIQPPPSWDPWAAPGGPSTAPLLPQDPYLSSGISPFETMPPLTRFMQQIRVEDTWLVDQGPVPFGMNTTEVSATFAFPFLGNAQTPLLFTPGFAINWLSGPLSVANEPGNPLSVPDLPSRTYDVYLDTAWNPQITSAIGAELGARIGLYTDFSTLITNSIRIQGHGMAVISLSPSFQIKAGIVYLDRINVKLLPAGGLVWTPNNDSRFEFLFPNPRLSQRLTTFGTVEWWYYLRGEYGGDAWTVQRSLPALGVERVGYNDIRVALGLQFERNGMRNGFIEVGVAFERQILYVEDPASDVYPSTTVFLGGGISF